MGWRPIVRGLVLVGAGWVRAKIKIIGGTAKGTCKEKTPQCARYFTSATSPVLTLDELLVDALAQALDVGGMDEQLGAVSLNERDALCVDDHVREGLPAVHGDDPARLALPAAGGVRTTHLP